MKTSTATMIIRVLRFLPKGFAALGMLLPVLFCVTVWKLAWQLTLVGAFGCFAACLCRRMYAVMPFPQAQRFVRSWRRIFMPWPSPYTDSDAARALELAFGGITIAPFLPSIMLFALPFLPSRGPSLAVIILAGTIMLVFFWLSLRFRIARRLLEQAAFKHLADLREHLDDQPST